MKVTLVADPDGCGDKAPCPKIWRTDDGRYWMQGARPPAELLAQLALPDHELIVGYDDRLIGWTPSER